MLRSESESESGHFYRLRLRFQQHQILSDSDSDSDSTALVFILPFHPLRYSFLNIVLHISLLRITFTLIYTFSLPLVPIFPHSHFIFSPSSFLLSHPPSASLLPISLPSFPSSLLYQQSWRPILSFLPSFPSFLLSHTQEP